MTWRIRATDMGGSRVTVCEVETRPWQMVRAVLEKSFPVAGEFSAPVYRDVEIVHVPDHRDDDVAA